jgi:hypothetical protein
VIPTDIAEQTLQVFANIRQALAAVDATLADVVSSRVFIQDPADVPAVMTIVGEKFRGIDPAATVTCPPLGSTVYKVELEVTAYRGRQQPAYRPLTSRFDFVIHSIKVQTMAPTITPVDIRCISLRHHGGDYWRGHCWSDGGANAL